MSTSKIASAVSILIFAACSFGCATTQSKRSKPSSQKANTNETTDKPAATESGSITSPGADEVSIPLEKNSISLDLRELPNGDWKKASDSSDDTVLALESRSGSAQIEVIHSKVAPGTSKVFFNKYHSTLRENNFKLRNKDDLEVSNRQLRSYNYEFTHKGVTLTVTSYQWSVPGAVFLVVTYAQDGNADPVTRAGRQIAERIIGATGSGSVL